MTPAEANPGSSSLRSKWWHRALWFTINEKGRAVPRKGLEREFDSEWRLFDRLAWMYEDVRCLPALALGMRAGKVAPVTMEAVKELPGFDQLDRRQRYALLSCYEQAVGKRPIVVRTNFDRGMLEDYSRPFPRECFDLKTSPHAVADYVVAWWQAEREWAGIRDEKKVGPRGGKSKNANQSYMPVDWHELDFVYDPIVLPMTPDGRTKLRKRLFQQAINNAPWLLAVWPLVRSLKTIGKRYLVPQPRRTRDLSKRPVSESDLKKALEKVFKRKQA